MKYKVKYNLFRTKASLVDENGRIIRGTWKYTVEIRLKNYKAFGADVESSSIVMDNIITVNGGF